MEFIGDIIILIFLIIFIVVGIFKNYRKSIIQLSCAVFFFLLFHFLFNKLMVESGFIDSLLQGFSASASNFVNQINNSLKGINKLIGDNSVNLIDDKYLSNEFYLTFLRCYSKEILSFLTSILSLILGLLIGLGIYLLVYKNKKDTYTFKKDNKKTSIRVLNAAINFSFGLIFVSLIASPLYLAKNDSINLLNNGINILSNGDMENFSSGILTYSDNVDKIEAKFNNMSKDTFDNVSNSFNDYNNKYLSKTSGISKLIDICDNYILRAEDLEKNPTNLDNQDKYNAYTVKVSLKSLKEEIIQFNDDFNTEYNDFNSTREKIDNVKDTIDEYKTSINDIKSQLNTLSYLKTNELQIQLNEYKKMINSKLPDLKIFKFLIIDIGYSSYNKTSTKKAINDAINYLNEYSYNLISESKVFLEKIDLKVQEFDENYINILNEIDKYKEKINKGDYDSDLEKIDSNIDYYNSELDKLKTRIDYLEKKRSSN